MLSMIQKILQLLTPQERLQLLGLLIAAIVSAALETLGVASIMPFIGVLSQPEVVRENAWMNWAYNFLGFSDTHTFLIFLGFVVLGFMVLTNSIVALTTWLTERFVWTKHHKLSQSLLQEYLARPYVSFLNRNSADLAKNILVEVYNLTKGILAPAMQLIVSGISTVAIVTLLVLINAQLALMVSGVLVGGYAVVYLAIRHRLYGIGKRRLEANTARFKAVNEALGGIKDVKVLGREHQFVRKFGTPSKQYSYLLATAQILSALPQYALETFAFGSILLMVLYLTATQGDVRQIIPIVGLYAFAGYRLMPSLKSIFKDVTQIRFQQAVVDVIHEELRKRREWFEEDERVVDLTAHLSFGDTIELRDISFTYPGTKEPVLHNINLIIKRNQSIALVGPTGVGKTTLVDIILGLLIPETGYLMVDGKALRQDSLPAWRRMIGYVPQDIFLCDDTIARNIAFGIPDSEIDRAAVEQAARIANLHDFITHDLPARYDTLVGERGVRLSGGQRQRIGIARALYHSPSVLVLDEATSSLDAITEDAVLQAIVNIAQTKTLIIIAHRLSTIRLCNVIYLLSEGCIVAHGTYEDLILSEPGFRAMAHLASESKDAVASKLEFAR